MTRAGGKGSSNLICLRREELKREERPAAAVLRDPVREPHGGGICEGNGSDESQKRVSVRVVYEREGGRRVEVTDGEPPAQTPVPGSSCGVPLVVRGTSLGELA